MQEHTKVFIMPGKELTRNDLAIINESRVRELNSRTLINPQPENEDWEKLYFLAKNEDQLLAFGRIHGVMVNFLGKDYPILGTASLVAVVKGRGYGGLIASAMSEYIRQTRQTSIGFNSKSLSSLYKKHGRDILVNGMTRFLHLEPPKFPGGDANYISGDNGLMEIMLHYSNEKAFISRPHW
jgi:hypothetical protein